MNKTRMILGCCLAAAIVLVLFMGLRSQPILVEVAESTIAPMQVTIEEEGKSRVKDRYMVSAPVSGYALRITLHVGDHVTQGSLLTEMEPLRSEVLDSRRYAEAEAHLAASHSAILSAEAQAKAAAADADFAVAEYQRKKKLKDNISEEALGQAFKDSQRAMAVLRSANFMVDVARYEKEAASTLLKYSAADESKPLPKERVAVRSPINGTVLKIHKESEGVTRAGAPLIELGDSKALEIAVDVLSFDAVRIKPGMIVDIKRWGGSPLTGAVKLVEPVGFTEISALGVEEQRVLVIVEITSQPDQWHTMGDGYRVEASFVLWSEEDVLQIPESSIFKTHQGYALYRVIDERAVFTTIEIGQRNGLNVQVLKGLDAGEQVIQHPDDALKEGSRIKIRQ